MVSGRIIVTGFVLLIIAVVGIVATRWAHRRFAALLVAVGVVLAVGVHPIDDPSPLMRLLRGDGESGAALALRSSTRAVPMLVLGLALGAGALVDAAGTLRLRSRVPWRPILAAVVVLLAIANLPSLTGHRLVDPAIDHDEHPPAAWEEATAALDAGDTGARVLQLPGQEFGAFRWGYTVDPPLPGMTNKPLVTRDLLPLGSAPAMDLLFALDDRFQAGVVDPARSRRWPACSAPTRSGSPATPRSSASARRAPRWSPTSSRPASRAPGRRRRTARRCRTSPPPPMSTSSRSPIPASASRWRR